MMPRHGQDYRRASWFEEWRAAWHSNSPWRPCPPCRNAGAKHISSTASAHHDPGQLPIGVSGWRCVQESYSHLSLPQPLGEKGAGAAAATLFGTVVLMMGPAPQWMPIVPVSTPQAIVRDSCAA